MQLLLLMTTRRLLQLLLLISAVATTSAAATLYPPGHDPWPDDERALVAFKAKISGHSGVLDSWNQSTSYCSWVGVTCGRKHRWRVVALNLTSQGLAGTISPAIGNLTFLRWLNLSSNGLQGEIPPSIGSLWRLRHIDLGLNMLTGVIPSNISRCISLREMHIYSNKGVQGIIPAEIGNMPSLSVLVLKNNSITGTIPSSLGNLSRLALLSLSRNFLEGPIPAGIGNNPYLGVLDLSLNNLSGFLPPSLFNLSSISLFYAAVNQLRGHLPSDLGNSLPSIQQLGIGENRFTGALPLSLTNLSRLQLLDLGINNFTGVVPAELGRLQQLKVFALYENMLEANNEEEWEFIGSLANCSRLQQLIFGWNRFAGKLPGPLVNLSTNLHRLTMEHNSISGVIPLDIGNLAGLEMLDFTNNLLTGVIPESLGKLTRLQQLGLTSNYLSGHLPSSIGNLSSLLQLYARDNSLEGPIPPSIGNLSKLLALSLYNNNLTGLIPNEIMELPSISMFLDLSNNMLEGPLPLEVGSLVLLEQLFLYGNKLSGEIPNTIGNCRAMEILYMDDNSFQGSIPSTFKNMVGLTVLGLMDNKLNGSIPGNLATLTNLQELYLGHNNLSGTIPELLGNSTSLLRLDLSYNNLQGEIPKEGVFKNLTGLSIVGNNGLCGGIPQLHLPKCPSSCARKNRKGIPKFLIITIPIIGSLILLFLLWAGYHHRKFKTVPKKDLAPQFAEIELPIVPYNDIMKGTNGFSEANVLGKGRYGTVYKGTLENQAIVVAVKVFHLQQSGSYKSFQAECEALRRVRHRCLLKIITCCSSINHQGQDFRALVFEFMANGSLDRWIHPNLDGQNGHKALSLSQRLDIAVDIVDALDYLHNGCQPSIIHCDLKPSNILLNQDMRARVGDFGIARVLDEATSKHHVNSSCTIGIRGSIGYIAPEYGEGLAVSTCGDVFSFGITLIEMFTGKNPTDDMFRDGISLHYYAKAALPDNIMEIADSNIWLHDGVNNSNDIAHITRTWECLSAVIKLGVICSKQLPTGRLSMNDAAAEMHAIRDKYIFTQ
ncbi:probable LRR receptor-like serine/threonine-protein kinase At3g47570 [Miscanthus floridulus]|uniref:probable LRR receptor-like serine/threonine-protein kinase At3g47570 n=1 Tax=Miscanthus floridulus TaxID=154761 RepID=UPI003457E329